MTQLGNSLLMLKLLENGRKRTINELANIIEVSPRMIRSYRDNLEQAGIYIETIRGKYGGFILRDNMKTILPPFTFYDLQTLEKLLSNKNLLEQVLTKKEQIYFNDVIEKIRMSVIYHEKNTKQIDTTNLQNEISKLISHNQSCILSYNKNGITKSVQITPQCIYCYENVYYLTAMNEEQKVIRTYSFNEIIKINS